MTGGAQRAGRVAGKIALVTGGGGGIGGGIALLLASEGARVFVSDRDGEAAGRTASTIPNAQALTQDVTSDADWRRVLDAIVETCGRIDILVNNAGIALAPNGGNALHELTVDAWRSIVEVNGLGVALGCRHAMENMRATGGGAIVNIASIAALAATPAIVAYGFTKAGLIQLTRTVAAAGAPDRIRCNAVLPGVVRTAMVDALERHHRGAGRPGDEEATRAFTTRTPLGLYQSPEDIAHGVLYLASDEARMVTGAQLVIDGGLTL